jgi:hypothetical protein
MSESRIAEVESVVNDGSLLANTYSQPIARVFLYFECQRLWLITLGL